MYLSTHIFHSHLDTLNIMKIQQKYNPLSFTLMITHHWAHFHLIKYAFDTFTPIYTFTKCLFNDEKKQ